MGRYCDSGNYSSWTSFLCLKELKICNPGTTYRVFISDRKYVMILLQLDKNLNPIETRNLYNGGEFTMLDSAKYLAVYLHTPSSYQIRYKDNKGKDKVVTTSKNILHITVTSKTELEMADYYHFNKRQRQQLEELLNEKYASLWSSLLYGSSGGNTAIVEVAESQIGNVGGQPYWS